MIKTSKVVPGDARKDPLSLEIQKESMGSGSTRFAYCMLYGVQYMLYAVQCPRNVVCVQNMSSLDQFLSIISIYKYGVCFSRLGFTLDLRKITYTPIRPYGVRQIFLQ